MAFWIIALPIGLLATLPLALALLKRQAHGSDARSVELRVYRDQLAEVERDLGRGMLSEADADRARLEIQRRILAADREARAEARAGAAPIWLAALVGIAVLGGGAALYDRLGAAGYPDLPLEVRKAQAEEVRRTRPAQAEVEADVAPSSLVAEADPSHLELLDKLKAALEGRDDDLQGQQLLARNSAAVGQFVEAYQAQQRVIAIKGEAVTATDYADLADMMILAAGGYVSPEAETALVGALQRDAQNGTAIYYLGLMFAQTGRPDQTFGLWEGLLSSSQPDDPWVPPIRAQIEAVAQAAGVRYTLPPEGPALAGPTADDVANAAEMTDDDRQAMIASMVERLSARLANEGGTADEWARLISSLGVLGDTAQARAIWTEAQVIFGADAAALATVRQAAESAGVTQ